MDWIRANGLDPNTLPRYQVVEVHENTLRVTEFVLNPDGSKKLSGDEVATAQFFTTLISAPENHGL
jgi:hypothetical protein